MTLSSSIRNGFHNPLAVAFGFVALATVSLLMPLPRGGREVGALSDMLHAPVFAILALLTYRILEWRGDLARPHAVAIALGVAIGFGCATEITQYFVGRSPSLQDLAADALGAMAGTAWALRRSIHWRPARLALPVLAILLLLVAATTPLLILTDAWLQRRDLPRVASFEQPLELSRWQTWDCRIQRVSENATDGRWALKMDLQPGPYSGIGTPWPPRDWSTHAELVLDVELEVGPPIDLIVKVEDERGCQASEAGFEPASRVEPGRRRIVIPCSAMAAGPDGRPLDLRNIVSLQVFAVHLDQPRTLLLDNIHLR